MLSYPICPFFIVFCNVVGTSNAQDFQLLQDVTDGISSLVSQNKFVNRLHRLCETLLGLCKELVQSATTNGSHAMAMGVPGAEVPMLRIHTGSDHANVPIANGDINYMSSSWNTDMMSQLFQSNPSLDWFNAEIPDPWDFSMPQ
jgi:hypothetical protein